MGADLGWVMRHFHLTREELRDYCPEAVLEYGRYMQENYGARPACAPRHLQTMTCGRPGQAG